MSSIDATNHGCANKIYDFFTKSKVGITISIVTEVALCVVGILALTQNLPGVGMVPGAILTGSGGVFLLLTIALVSCRCWAARRGTMSGRTRHVFPSHTMISNWQQYANRVHVVSDQDDENVAHQEASPTAILPKIRSDERFNAIQEQVIGCKDIVTKLALLFSVADIQSCASVSLTWQKSFDCDQVWQMLLEREYGLPSKLEDNKAFYRKPGYILARLVEQKRIQYHWSRAYSYVAHAERKAPSSNLQMIDNILVSSVSEGRAVVLMDSSSGKGGFFNPNLATLNGFHLHGDRLRSFHMIDAYRVVACYSYDPIRIVVINPITSKRLKTFEANKEVIEFRVMNSNTTLVALCGDNSKFERHAEVWDINSGTRLKGVYAYGIEMSCTQVNDNIIACGRGNSIHIFDLKSEESSRALKNRESLSSEDIKDNRCHISCLWANNKTLVSGARDGVIKIWDLSSSTCVQTLSEWTGVVSGLLLIGDTLVAGYADGSIKIFDISTSRCLGIVGNCGFPITHLLNDGNLRIFSGSADGEVTAWGWKD